MVGSQNERLFCSGHVQIAVLALADAAGPVFGGDAGVGDAIRLTP
jgi:hypothetical protein